MDRVSKLIEEIRVYGVNNEVPIMSVETIDTIKKIIIENNIHSILEIGTAIAYSTINFASYLKMLLSKTFHPSIFFMELKF